MIHCAEVEPQTRLGRAVQHSHQPRPGAGGQRRPDLNKPVQIGPIEHRQLVDFVLRQRALFGDRDERSGKISLFFFGVSRRHQRA